MDTQSSEESRQWSASLEPGQDVQEVYLVAAASSLQARNGPFWRLELKDAKGSVEAKIWSPLSQNFAEIPVGSLAMVQARVESYREQNQLNVQGLQLLDDLAVAALDLSLFLPASSRSPAVMYSELLALCKQELKYKPWRKFMLSVLQDADIKAKFMVAPAAKGVHHAWVGGLLEHSLSVAGLCLRLCDHFAHLDRQTLLVAAICHDLGKIWELSGGLANDYTDPGRLIGHINLALEYLNPFMLKSGLEAAYILHLKHLILSHHGQYEYGSPRLPQTPEAFALHYADNLDAKLTQTQTVCAGLESQTWSSYQRTLERALYVPVATPLLVPEQVEEAKAESKKTEPKVNQCSLL